MNALSLICATLGLEYSGIDFALATDGSILVFEANATMIMFLPTPDRMWDYCRRAISTALEAATRMLQRRVSNAAASARTSQ
jgi:glutathione synthase/RimK-type ligase-like ATP-grasp enzyme